MPQLGKSRTNSSQEALSVVEHAPHFVVAERMLMRPIMSGGGRGRRLVEGLVVGGEWVRCVMVRGRGGCTVHNAARTVQCALTSSAAVRRAVRGGAG
jgi:hypothetical protein